MKKPPAATSILKHSSPYKDWYENIKVVLAVSLSLILKQMIVE
jgi:hypothetical protein